MAAPGWLQRSLADVPEGDGWLGPRERAVLAGLSRAPRVSDWRLGRWTAKAAICARLGCAPPEVEVLAADDGAPEAWIGDEPASLSLSLSHRAGESIAVVAQAGHPLGCDLELVEPRSDAFVAEWLSPEEQRWVGADGQIGRPLRANLAWAAKEAVAKARREGLRLNVRALDVRPEGLERPPGDWRALTVAEPGAAPLEGWWRGDRGWVVTVVTVPPATRPEAL